MDTRDRILQVTAELFRRQGYSGTGLKQISSQSKAALGSLYHFFPGGKEALGVEVVRTAGEGYRQLGAAFFTSAPDVVTALADFFHGAAEVLRQTDYADACPIATVALEVASTNEPLRAATSEVFESWVMALTGYYTDVGIAAGRAKQLAIEAITALEGAFVLSRAMRDAEPVEIAGRMAVASLRAALPATDGGAAA